MILQQAVTMQKLYMHSDVRKQNMALHTCISASGVSKQLTLFDHEIVACISSPPMTDVLIFERTKI